MTLTELEPNVTVFHLVCCSVNKCNINYCIFFILLLHFVVNLLVQVQLFYLSGWKWLQYQIREPLVVL